MTRLIDAEILFEKVGNIKPKNKSEYELLGKFMNMITNSPTVERPHGEWIESKERKRHFYCSECVQEDPETGKWRETFDFKYPFCPNCGADMRKEGEAE